MQPLDHRVPTGHRAQSHLKWVLRLCVVVVALGWSLIEAFGQPAHRALAQPSAQLELTESVSASQVESGAPFQYLLVYGCIDTGTNCTGATITDVLPPQLTYIPDSASKTADVQSVTFTPDPSGATGGTLTWHFKDPLPSGRSGMVRFQAKFPPGTVPGTTALDHATFSASNAASVTTVDVATTATGVFEMFARKQGGPAITGNATDFSVEICSPDDVGGVRLMSPVITDTLPAGAIFIGAEGTQDVDWTYSPVISPNIGGTVTFVNLPPVPVGECLARRVTIRYNLVPGSQQTNAILASGTPEGCTGSPLPAYCQGQSTRTLSANLPFSVINPYAQATTSKTSTSLSSFEGTEARPGETVTYTVSAGNAGYLALANTIVTDTVPIELALASWTAGGAPTRPVMTAYQLNGGSWVVVPNGPFTSDAVITVAQLNLPPGNAITALRWELGTVAVGAAGWNARVAGAVKNTLVPQDPPQTFQNCVTTGSKTLTQTVQSCNNVRVVANRSIPRVTRSGTPGVRYPLEVIDYTVELSHAGVAQLPLDNPVLADLIAPELTIVPGSVLFDTGASAPGAPVPNFEVLANYGGSGKTLLRWSWTNKAGSGGADARFSLQPGRKLVVRYQVMVVDGTVPGVYDTMTALADWSGPTNPNNPTNPQNIFLCNGDAAYVDTLDLDGDGIFTERSCKQSLPAAVGVSLALQGRKYVRGLVDCATYGTAACEDGDFNKLGLTVPGGAVDYRVVITNSSNVSVTNLVMVDILPAIGDTAVVASVNRLSAWRPNLQGPVTGPGGVPLTIWYSTKGNPCRPEMIASGPPGCEAPSWSTTLPGDPTSVRSIKIELCNYDINGQRTECLVLPRGSSVTFDWPMVAPYDAPADASCLTPPQGHLFNRAANPACQIAWNSFGFSAVEATQPPGAPGAVVFQPAEPSKTGVRVGPAGAGAYTVGNLVWLDVAGWENDGIQQSVEQMVGGLSGIRVELYNGAGAYLAYRITGPSNTGQPGYYAFTNLPAGSYKLRFYLPAGFSPAPQNAGSDDALDSDGFSSGTDPTYGDYYETELFNLTADDLTRDFGVWRPVDYGDAPAQYPTVVSEANQGDAARHVIVSGIRLGATVDAETNGQPHAKAHGDDTVGAPDDEDGIGFPSYLGTAALPTAVMFIGESSTLTVTAATIDPVSRPGYLSAWIDFNRNNVWEVTEQVITNLAINGVAQVSVTVPATATAGGTVARFRYSTQPSLPPTGTASDGEVEDYAVQLLAAPQKTIAVTSEAHSLDPEVVIGEIVRYRLVAQIPEGQVTNFKIEDRIPFNLQFFDDGTAKVAFVSTNGITSTDAGLNGAAVAGNAPVTPSFVIPAANISGGPFGSGTKPVFSFGTLTNPDTDADAEYVVVELNALVLNSSFNQDGQTRTNSFVVSFDNVNRESSGVTVTIRKPAVRITKELLTRPAQLAPGVAVTYTIEISHAFWSNADAFEVVISDVVPPELENPQIISVTSSGVTPPVDAGSIVDSMIRVPAAGEFDLPRGAWVRIYFSATIASDVPSPYVIKNVGRVDWTSLPDNGTAGNPTGSTTPGPSGERDGERNGYGSYNDYRSTNSAEFQVDSDWGDLPDGPYPTKKANNGASHLVQLSGNPFLGAQVDIDDIDRINASATGDDNGDRNDDEDGVVFLTPFQPGQPAVVRVTTGTPGYLSVFIDFDDNGTLDTVPITSVTTVSGTGTGYIPNGGLIGDMYFNAAGTYDLTIPVPANAVGPMASRFRFTKTAGEGGNSPLGKAASGEVEDYILNSVGDQLWIDDGGPNLLNAANGRFDAGESPVPAGVALALVRSGTTTPIATATTDASGRYRFNGLSPGDYQIVVTAANFQPGGPLAGTLSTFTAEPNANADGDNNDNGIDVLDPAVSGIASSSFTLDLATEPDVAIDGDGVNSNLTVDFGFVRNDWGDLPDGPYNSDGIGTAGPSHTVVPGLYMGALVDAEVTGQPDAAAQGDDLNGGADDEDGVTLPPYFFAGSTTTVPVNVVNSTAVQAVLYGFIDFNGDGDFLDAGEKVTATVPASTSGPVNLLFNVPTSATTAASFGARFRLSTSNNLTADGPAPNGEVEDYLATAQRFDLALTKVLASGQGSTMRSGDTVTFTLNVINQGTLPAYNIALVDYLPPGFTLADSDWTDLGDGRAVLNAPLAGPLTPAATASVDITLYTGTRTGGIFKNYAEISAADNDTDAGNPLPVDADSTPDANNSESPVVDNEINKNGKFTPGDDEDDHDVAAIEVLVFDWGDLPDGNAVNSPNYQTLQANGGPVHQMIPGLRLGALVDSEFNGQPAAAADGDDTVDSDDEDGVAFPIFYASKQAVVTATVFITTGQPSRLYSFIDFNGDGDFNDTNEAVSSVVSSSGSVPVTFTVPLGADTTKLLGARFRLSTAANLGSGGAASNGEVEDYLIQVLPVYDHGDLPDAGAGTGPQDYQTLLANGGPRHQLVPGVYLGAGVDDESDGQPTVGATGDDANGDDDDGVIFRGPATPGTTVQIEVIASTAGYLNAWFDWNENGDLEASEQPFLDRPLVAGSNLLDLAVPAGISPAEIFCRFRFTTGAGQATTSGGTATNGEVEDYVLMSLGDNLWLDNGEGSGTPDDGIQNGNEVGVAGVTVQLRGANNQVLATTYTDGAGHYFFTGVAPGVYTVTIPALEFQAGGKLEKLTAAPSMANIHRADGVSSPPLTLVAGQAPDVASDGNTPNSDLTVDFGFVKFDLALRMTVAGFSDVPLLPGQSKVTFQIEIINQGAGKASNVQIVDYVQTGFTYRPEDNPGWTAGPNPTTTITGPIPPGGSASVSIVLRLDLGTRGQTLANFAEIASDGAAAGADFDSTPDSTNQETPVKDDVINEDARQNPGIDDEDDHDVAQIVVNVFDLALRKRLASVPAPIVIGQSKATFTLEIINQGNLSATQVVLADYLPPGLTYNPVDNPTWTAAATSMPTTTVAGPIAPGSIVTVTLVLGFDVNAPGRTLRNAAEIAAANDTIDGNLPPKDVDSIADTDSGNDGLVQDDVLNGDGRNQPGAQDEDDHDIATVVLPGLKVGNLIWHDADDDGLLDAGEQGIDGVTVQLYAEGATPGVTPPLSTTVSAGGGKYLFSDLEPGRYFVRIPTPPAQYPTSSTTTDTADNKEDGDDNGSQDTPGGPTVSPVVDVRYRLDAATQYDGDQTVDFGFFRSVTLGDLVWHDSNNNGTVDSGESGIDGVRVEVYRQGQKPGTDTPVAAVTTSGGGRYRFDRLLPGQYIVYIPTPPAQYTISSGNTDTADNGVNSNDNGTQAGPGKPVTSPTITLASGSEPTSEDGDANTDLTVDFGFYGFDLALRKKTLPNAGVSLAPGVGKVTFEIVVYNQGDVPASNVTVIDYVPYGLTYDAAQNPGWSRGPNPTITIAGPIAPGGSVAKQITLGVAAGTAGATLQNAAEIAADGQPAGSDRDSTPDSTNNESPVKDDVVNEDARNNPGSADEDDHDVASVTVPVFDLSLRKRLADGQANSASAQSDVRYTLEISNEGNMAAKNVVVADYIPAGLVLSPNDKNGWTSSGNHVQLTVPGPIEPGAKASISIVLEVSKDTLGAVNNRGEIVSAQDLTGALMEDIDSRLDDDPDNDGCAPDACTDTEDDYSSAVIMITEPPPPDNPKVFLPLISGVQKNQGTAANIVEPVVLGPEILYLPIISQE